MIYHIDIVYLAQKNGYMNITQHLFLEGIT